MPERKPINEYDALLQQKSADKALRQTLTGATMHDPDAFAESQRLAAESGVPAPIIARNPDPVKQRTQVNEYEAALKKYPQLREFIANNPSAAVVAQDDLDNMGAIEIAIDRTKSYGRALAAGPAALATGFAGIEEFMARGIEADFERFARWGIIPENPFRGLGEKAAAGRRFGQELTETIAGPDPVGAGSTELGIRSGLQSAGMNLPPLLASYVSGNPGIALTAMSASAGGLKFGEAIDQGASTGLAFQAAVNEGVIEAITERLPAFKLFGDLKKGTPFYKTILAQMAIEIPSEQAATVLQDFSDWMLLHPEKTTQEFLNERSGAAYQTLIATVVGTGVQTGAIAGIDRLQRRGTDDMTRASSALEAQDALRKLTEAAANSKTLSRDRNTVEAAAQSMAGEDAEDLYIDASIARDVLNQEGINIEDILDDAPSLREQFEEAVALGGEVRIPVAEFVARVADKSYAEFLIPHVRIGADNMTAAEAQEFTEEQAERFRQEAEELLGEDADTQQIQAEIDELADTIAAQVEATGRFPNDIAQSYGSLAASFFATTAARAGMSPAQMAERFALQVQGESVEGALDQVQAPQAYLAENAPEVAPEGFTRFRHFGQLPVPTLDPAFMGTGIRGAERARGANRQPVLSLYPDQGFVKEVGLGNVEFVVDLPSDRVYDLGEDPLNLTEQAQDVTGFRIENGEQVPVSTRTDFNQLEQLIQEAGFLGYVTPDGEDNLAGQARLFDRVEVEGVDTSEAEALLDNPLFQLKPEFEPVGFKNVARHLNPDELQNLRRDTAQKLVNLFGELPRDIDFADTALAGEAKRGWYNRATLALREIFGETDAPRFAALVAALSPQTSVQINLENAALAWVAWNEAGRPEGADEINQVLNQSVGKGNPNSVLNAWRNNAVRALSTPDAMEIMLSGPKVNSFMHNLLGNMQEVTNDAWMAAFALMEQTIFSGSMTKSGPGKRPGYLAFTAKIRRAADKLGWTPAEVQETIWSWVKTAYELSDAAGETRSVEELLQAGEITDERIANTPSFADLFIGQASIREILEAAGYGEQIQAIEEELTDDRDPGEGAGTTRVTPGLLRTARRLDALKRQRAEAERLNREAATPIDGDALPPIFLVLSGEDATLTPEENVERINQLEQDLEEMGLDPQRADGMYKGVSEASFLVPAENDKQIAAVYNLAFEKYGQESVLHVDQDRNARLEFEEDFPVALGKFIETRDTTGLEAFTSIGGRSFTTVAEEAAPLFQQLPTVLGMYSGVAKAAQDMKLPEWKQDDTKPISGRAIWQKLIKMPGVKKEEIELLGLEEYLTAKKKDKFSRQAVLDYINNNGAHVEEVVATEADTNETGGVPFDDPVALSVEETRSFLLTRAMSDYDIGHTDAGGFNVQDLTLKWAEENIDVVLDEFLPANLVAPSARAKFEAMSPKEALDTIIADNGEGTVTTALRANTKLRAHFEERFTNFIDGAPSQMNPARVRQSQDIGADDNYLWVVSHPSTDWFVFDSETLDVTDTPVARADSPNEIEIQVKAYARDIGMLEFEVGDTTTRWEEFVEGDYENYRELKFLLPGDGNREPFLNDIHFDDPNILAFQRITDRQLVMEQDAAAYTYHIDELQSDWHQQGRQVGYADPNVDLDEALNEFDKLDNQLATATKGAFGRFMKGDMPGGVVTARVNENVAVLEARDDSERAFEVTPQKFEAYARNILRGHADAVNALIGGVKTPGAALISELLDDTSLSQRDRAYQFVNSVLQQEIDAEGIRELEKVATRHNELGMEIEAHRASVPDAPWKDDGWLSLSMKRSLILAAEQGYEQFSWADKNTLVNRWSREYEKLYDMQYDKKMPSIVKKLTGQKPVHMLFGGQPIRDLATVREEARKSLEARGSYTFRDGHSLEVQSDGTVDLFDRGSHVTGYLDIEDALKLQVDRIGETGSGYWVIELTEELREKILGESFPLFQAKRGQIQLGDQTRPSIITLLQDADLSTFLHEGGHFFLEVTARAAQLTGNENMQADMATLLEWFGYEGTLEEWLNLSIEERRDAHEQFARGFEAYLFEGKAPNQEMRELFRRFRNWLVQIYKNLRNLDVELTDEVRAVMDRMLATDEEIKNAETVRRMAPLFTSAEDAGMTEDEFLDYQALGTKATNDAADELQRRSLRDMKWLRNARNKAIKKIQKEARAKRKAVREEVELEIRQRPIRVAESILKTGKAFGPDGTELDLSGEPHKLSVELLEDDYGTRGENDAVLEDAGLQPQGALWSRLPTIYKTKGEGLDADTVASLVGLTSGDELIRSLLELTPIKEEIEARTDVVMLQRYGDLTDPDAIERAADVAVHNDVRMKMVAAEYRALREANRGQDVRGRVTVNAIRVAAKQFADAIVGRRKVRDLKPAQFSSAETKAARQAEEALARGDSQAAATAKRNQMLNGYAGKAANKAKDEIDRKVRYLNKFNRAGVRKNLDPEYVDQIDKLLERVDIRQKSLREIDKRESLQKWIESQEAQGLEPVIDDRLRDEATRKHYKNMTVDEFRGLVDTVRSIEHLARLKHKLLKAAEERRLDQAVDAAVASIEENAKKVVPEELENNRFSQRLKQGITGFFAMHRKMASVLREMDGWKDGGEMWTLLMRPFNDAADQEAVMRAEATVKLTELFEPIKDGLRTKVYIPEINASLSKEGRLAIALNQGNEANKQRVRDGDRWTEDQVQAIMDTLSKEDMDFVQSVWDYIGTYWSQIEAKEKRVYGVAPERVQATPVVTRHGTYRGGYYPIAFDPLRSSKAEADNVAEQTKNALLGAYTRAQTKRGHTKARVEEVQNRPVRKDFGVIFEHLTNVIHDVTHHEVLIDANRLLTNQKLDTIIRRHYGAEVLRQLRNTVRDIATGDAPARDMFERSINHLRTGATIAGLGYNLMTGMLQPLGLSQSWVRIGPKWVARGLSRWIGSAARMENALKDIHRMSDFMRLRSQTMQREISEIANKVSGKSRPMLLSTDAFFWLIVKLQLVADVPTWLGAYEKAMELENADEKKAIAMADQAVLDAQGGGQVKDLAAIQRGGPLMKLFTNFYSFFNTTYNMLAEATGKQQGAGRRAVDYLMLLTVPAVLSSLLYDALRADFDDWDDEEEMAKRLAREQIAFAMSTMVGVRELGSALQGYSYKGPAGLRFFTEASSLMQQAEQGELDAAALKALNNTAGIVLHYPAGQVQRTVEGVVALSEGDTESPLAVVTGPPKE